MPLFDSFEQVRRAAEAERLRAGHMSAFRFDDGSSVPAKAVLGAIASDDSERADSARLAFEKMMALYALFTADQRTRFDQRIIQALRDSLGDHPRLPEKR